MIKSNQKIFNTGTLYQSIQKMTKSGSKTLCVVDKKDNFLGTISDGDIRKIILKEVDLNLSIDNFYNKNPTFFYEGEYKEEALIKIFTRENFDIIPIVNNNLKLIKIINWKNLLEKQDSKIFASKQIDIPVVIMAGGIGERLRPFTNILPKPLIPINGKPVIEIIMEKFKAIGINQFIVSKNQADKILTSFLMNYKYKNEIKYVNEKEKLGTAGSLFLMKKIIKNNFIVINCDVILNIDYLDLINFHLKNKYDLTLVVSELSYTIPYGNILLDKNSNFLKIQEKPKIKIISNTGCYILNDVVKKFLKKKEYLDMNHLIHIFKKNKKKIGLYHVNKEKWHDTGQWQEFDKTSKYFEGN